jgi:hypothetical protein
MFEGDPYPIEFQIEIILFLVSGNVY